MMKITNEEVRIALERIDGVSWAELGNAIPADVAETLKVSIRREGNVTISHCLASDAPLGNRAIGLGLAQPCTREQVMALTNEFIASGMKNFALQISPYAQPKELAQWLADAGLVIRNHSVKLLRGDRPLPISHSAFEVRRMQAGDNLLFGDVSARGFGRPPIIAHWMGATVSFPRWRHYLAYADGQAAGAAAMYVDGEYAWLGIGSTLPDYRERGVQKSLIAQRIADGLGLGVKYFISETESVNASCRNLMQAGFERAYMRPNYGMDITVNTV